jgi:hypothetical protein
MPYNKNKRTFYVAVFLVASGTILAIYGTFSEKSRYRPNMVSIVGVILGIIGLILLGLAVRLKIYPD